MGTTPVYHWPYPELNNPPDGATQMKNLALAIEPTVKTNADNVAVNTDAINAIKAPPICVVYQTSTTQSIANGVNTAITFEFEISDVFNMHSTSTNVSRITCVLAGWHRLGGAIRWVGNATGRRAAQWYVNGVATEPTGITIPAVSTGSVAVSAPDYLVKLAVGDYVELMGYQDSGAALATLANANVKSYACAQWICA